ncbi:MAG: hypothetical protein KJ592_04290 [Nanoarchaeota archaeon]|nr:hypothetical protein [Nanoarchaeota archaeon]
MVTINIGRRELVVFVGVLVLFVAGVVSASSMIGHEGDKILVESNGYFMALSEAVSGGYLAGGVPSGDLTTVILGASHDADNIYVSVDGVESSLSEAIAGGGLCGSVVSSYGSDIVFGHSGDEVDVSVEGVSKSLQDAINEGDFCRSVITDWDCRLDGWDATQGMWISSHDFNRNPPVWVWWGGATVYTGQDTSVTSFVYNGDNFKRGVETAKGTYQVCKETYV